MVAGWRVPVRLENSLVDGHRPSGVVSPTTCGHSMVGSCSSVGLGFVLGVLAGQRVKGLSGNVRGGRAGREGMTTHWDEGHWTGTAGLLGPGDHRWGKSEGGLYWGHSHR